MKQNFTIFAKREQISVKSPYLTTWHNIMNFWDSKKQKPEIVNVEITAKSRFFEIQAVDLHFSNGQKRTYERLTPARHAAVMVLAVQNDALWMVREYAVGTERYELTFVKGMMEANETPEQAANRELQEEMGYAAHQWTYLRQLYSSPSHMYVPIHVLVAQDLYPSKKCGDEPEDLELVRVPLCQIDDLIDNSNFSDARVLAALMLFQRHI